MDDITNKDSSAPLSHRADHDSTEFRGRLYFLTQKTTQIPADCYQTPADLAEALKTYIDQRIDEKLRERGFDAALPKKPVASVEHDEARDWYDRLAGYMWSVACINLLGSGCMALLIVLAFR